MLKEEFPPLKEKSEHNKHKIEWIGRPYQCFNKENFKH